MISPSQRPLPDNTQHSQQKNILATGGIRTLELSRRAAIKLRLRLLGHWDLHIYIYIHTHTHTHTHTHIYIYIFTSNNKTKARFHTSAAVKLRYYVFWNVECRRFAVAYQRFGQLCFGKTSVAKLTPHNTLEKQKTTRGNKDN